MLDPWTADARRGPGAMEHGSDPFPGLLRWPFLQDLLLSSYSENVVKSVDAHLLWWERF